MKVRPRLAVAVLLLIAATLLSVVFWNEPAFLISSDSLLPAAFVWDVLHHSYAWSNFQQARVPSFFPDLLIYAPVQILTGSWRLAMTVWIFVVVGWLLAIGTWITARLARASLEVAALSFLLPCLVFMMGAAFGFPRFAEAMDNNGYLLPYLLILIPYTHGGSFLLALTAASVPGRNVEQAVTPKAFALWIFCCAGAVSDPICLVALLVPLTAAILASLSVGVVGRNTSRQLLAGAWGGAALGWLLARQLFREAMPMPSLASIREHLGSLAAGSIGHPGITIVVLGFVLLVGCDIRQRGLRGWLGSFWSVFGVTSVLGCLAVMIIYYQDIWSYRYALPLFWWTVILTAAALTRYGERSPSLLHLPVAGIIAGLALWDLTHGLHTPKLLVWEAPVASCLQKSGLRAGLADYWGARSNSAASNWEIQIEQITKAGAANVWGNDILWFNHDIHDGSRRPDYRFILMDDLSPDRIASVYGRPDNVMTCGQTTVWLYNDADQLYHNLARVSPFLAELKAPPAD